MKRDGPRRMGMEEFLAKCRNINSKFRYEWVCVGKNKHHSCAHEPKTTKKMDGCGTGPDPEEEGWYECSTGERVWEFGCYITIVTFWD